MAKEEAIISILYEKNAKQLKQHLSFIQKMRLFCILRPNKHAINNFTHLLPLQNSCWHHGEARLTHPCDTTAKLKQRPRWSHVARLVTSISLGAGSKRKGLGQSYSASSLLIPFSTF